MDHISFSKRLQKKNNLYRQFLKYVRREAKQKYKKYKKQANIYYEVMQEGLLYQNIQG